MGIGSLSTVICVEVGIHKNSIEIQVHIQIPHIYKYPAWGKNSNGRAVGNKSYNDFALVELKI